MPKRGPHNDAITWVPHLRVAWGGTLGVGREVWTNSVKFVFDDTSHIPTEADIASKDAGLKAWIGTWLTVQGGANGSSFCGQDALLTWIKCNPIGASGLQVRNQTHTFDVAGGVQGGDLNLVPYYQTYAVTFRTALKRGRGHSGRIFPPLVQPNIVAGTGMCSIDDASSMGKAASYLLQNISGILSALSPGKVCVLSPGNATKGTAPLSNPVVGCVVDRVPDVQHRRTNRLTRSEGTLTLLQL